MYKRSSKTKKPDSPEHGFEYAMFLLNLRLRTEGEIRSKMTERGYHASVIDSVITRLYEFKYLDDTRFGELLIDNYKKYKYYGYFQIKKKLMEKRLPSPDIERMLEEFFPIEDELQIAQRFLDKEKLSLESREDKARAARKLQAKGFRSSVVSKLLF
jgi:regulatory protein